MRQCPHIARYGLYPISGYLYAQLGYKVHARFIVYIPYLDTYTKAERTHTGGVSAFISHIWILIPRVDVKAVGGTMKFISHIWIL